MDRFAHIRSALASALVCLLAVGPGLAQLSVAQSHDVVRELRDKTISWTEPELAKTLDRAGAYLCDRLDASVGDALLDVASDAGRPAALRIKAFHTFMRCPDPKQAGRALEFLEAQVRFRENPAVGGQGDSASVVASDVLRSFVESASTPRWGEAFGSELRTADILSACMGTMLYRRCGNDLGQAPDPVAMIASAPLTTSVRARFAESLVAQSRTTTVDRRICDMLGTESMGRLRQLVQSADGAKPESIPYGAAFCMCHLGDESAAAVVEKLAAVVERPLPTDVGATTFRPSMAGLLRTYVTMSRAQRPPAKLLDVLREPPQADDQEFWLREWALTRAVGLGVDKAAIREAFLAYTAKVREGVAAGPQPRKTSIQHPRLSMLNELEDRAVVLGVLSSDEIPPRPERVLPAR